MNICKYFQTQGWSIEKKSMNCNAQSDELVLYSNKKVVKNRAAALRPLDIPIYKTVNIYLNPEEFLRFLGDDDNVQKHPII